MHTLLDLSGKRALIGGASQGIGKAVALLLAEMGASVTLLARNEAMLQTLCKTLPNNGNQEHHVLAADLQDTEALAQIIDRYAYQHNIHILVHNTGGPPAGQAHLADAEAYQLAFAQHLLSGQILVKALLPAMQQAKYGRIINIISTSVKQPIAGLGVSNTIRGAVANWAKTLSLELGAEGITVNNVLPGYTKTARLYDLIDFRAEQNGKPSIEVEREMIRQIPVGRFAEPAEIAQAVAFLASPAAAYINGINLPVDGGRTGSL
ncbi:SDR family oxidoreductase [Eisenibacter elegans]|uniref:SDR family oxidoreductase n=1 Tax=Eisenibacter elegans TaxID=997 RepID=UPI0003FC7D22|nr:SDR family oxidoreductase [Eisenibacter elegans]